MQALTRVNVFDASPLLIPASVEKVMKVDEHIGVAMSGLVADARTLIEHARVACQHHRFNYEEPMSVESCTQSICDLALKFGENDDDESVMSRPFGVALLVAGMEKNVPALFHADPSGTLSRSKAVAIGSASEGAMSTLQEEYSATMTLMEAENLALRILKEVMEERVTATNVEVAGVQAVDGKFRRYNTDEVKAIIDRM